MDYAKKRIQIYKTEHAHLEAASDHTDLLDNHPRVGRTCVCTGKVLQLGCLMVPQRYFSTFA